MGTAISALTAETAPAIDDLLALVDTSAGTTDKITLENLLKVVASLTAKSPVVAADMVLISDSAASNAAKKMTLTSLLALIVATANTFTENQSLSSAQAWVATQTLTDGANIAWDMDSGNVAKVTLGGNRTMNAPTNLKDGGVYILRVIQDGTGSRTITWNSVFKWPLAVAPTLTTTAGGEDILTFVSDGTNLKGTSLLDLR